MDAFWWLGQMAFRVEMDGRVLYFDLYLSDSAHRLVPPPLHAEDVRDADFVFGSHDHDDHIDDDTWRKLAQASPQARFVVPGNLVDALSARIGIDRHRFVCVDAGQTVDIDGLQITGIAAAHERLAPDVHGRHANMIYVVRAGSKLICHTGDTCIYEGLESVLRRMGTFDAVMLPINGRDAERLRRNCIGNMTYQEAVDLVGELAPRLAVPCHYDMFSGNTENPALFAEYLSVKYPECQCWIGAHGSKVDF